MNPCGTTALLAAAKRLGIGRKKAYRNVREHGELAPGIPVLPSFDARLRVATADVDRYLRVNGQAVA